MDISVIISTWNNAKRLAITLDELSKCKIPHGLKWELIVINNNCSDDTDAVVGNFKTKLPIVYAKEPQQGLSRARNKGLELARGELIIFTDDDVKPCEGWLVTYWSAFKDNPMGSFFGGPVESEFESLLYDNELLTLAPPSVKGFNLSEKSRLLSQDTYFISANWACPSKILKAMGGFDINKGLGTNFKRQSTGEETDLMARLKKQGLAPLYLPEAKLLHFVPADKCTMKHIASRAEAYEYDSVSDYSCSLAYSHILGVPRWMYKKVFILWRKWILAKVQRKKGYQEYIALRRMIGTIRGVRNNSNNGHLNPNTNI